MLHSKDEDFLQKTRMVIASLPVLWLAVFFLDVHQLQLTFASTLVLQKLKVTKNTVILQLSTLLCLPLPLPLLLSWWDTV
jgi:hypothetical protein